MKEFEAFKGLDSLERMEIAEERLLADRAPCAEDALSEQTGLCFVALRKEANIQGGALLIYQAILNVAVFAVVFAVCIAWAFKEAFGAKTNDFEAMTEKAMDASGWGYLAAVAIGLLILLLWKKSGYIRHTICQKGSPMTAGKFFALLSLAMAPQFIAQLSNLCLVWLVEMLGLDAAALEALGDANADTLSMFLYIGILAPISEELLFRGLLLRSIAPYSRKLAIFASSLLFGLYHANPIQTPYAFLVGIVLGYVAMEYHVLWAIALHLFNNLVFALLLPMALSFLPAVFIDWIMWALIIVFFLVALLALIAKWDLVRAHWKEERVQPWQRRAFFGSPTVIILMVLCLLNMAATCLLLL